MIWWSAFYFILFARKQQNGCCATFKSFAVPARGPDSGLLLWKGLQSNPWPVILDAVPMECPSRLWENGLSELYTVLWLRHRFPWRTGETFACSSLKTGSRWHPVYLLSASRQAEVRFCSVTASLLSSFPWGFLFGWLCAGPQAVRVHLFISEFSCSLYLSIQVT